MVMISVGMISGGQSAWCCVYWFTRLARERERERYGRKRLRKSSRKRRFRDLCQIIESQLNATNCCAQQTICHPTRIAAKLQTSVAPMRDIKTHTNTNTNTNTFAQTRASEAGKRSYRAQFRLLHQIGSNRILFDANRCDPIPLQWNPANRSLVARATTRLERTAEQTSGQCKVAG